MILDKLQLLILSLFDKVTVSETVHRFCTPFLIFL